jgi:hypothetical protein
MKQFVRLFAQRFSEEIFIDLDDLGILVGTPDFRHLVIPIDAGNALLSDFICR